MIDNGKIECVFKRRGDTYESIERFKMTKEEFTNFCRNQQLKKALLSSVDLLKAGDYDSIKFMIENAMKAGQDKNVGHEYNKDIGIHAFILLLPNKLYFS